MQSSVSFGINIPVTFDDKTQRFLRKFRESVAYYAEVVRRPCDLGTVVTAKYFARIFPRQQSRSSTPLTCLMCRMPYSQRFSATKLLGLVLTQLCIRSAKPVQAEEGEKTTSHDPRDSQVAVSASEINDPD